MSKLTAAEQEKYILEQAEARGVINNYFFRTTFDRYKYQLKIMRSLKKAIKEYGATVTKEYVKGRENVVANPAISEYNRTATAANNTVATLTRIIEAFADDQGKGGKMQKIMDMLNTPDNEG